MMLGTLLCMTGMLLLGFTRAVASIFTGWNNGSVRDCWIRIWVLSNLHPERQSYYMARYLGDLSH